VTILRTAIAGFAALGCRSTKNLPAAAINASINASSINAS
jgi:hypothetical protein